MKRILIPLLSVFCFSTVAGAGESLPVNAISVSDIKTALSGTAAEVSAPRKEALTADENQQLYLAGAAKRARISKEAKQYVKAEKERAIVNNAFLLPTPAGVKDPAKYGALREKNGDFIENVAYWQEQIKSNYSNLAYAVRVNDLTTANILINYMRQDHWAVINEVAAINENNRKAANWPLNPSNEQLYNAGAQDRASILEQAALCADLKGRDVPKNVFISPAPAGTLNTGVYEKLREKNAGFIGNIEYWRYQLEGNYGNLKEAVQANDLETARILLDYMKKDSADLDNEIKAVELNNAEAAKL